MFGPDKCDNHYKVHLIVRIPPCAADRVSPVRGHSELHFDQTAMYVERSRSSVYKHLENLFNDRKFHLYTLVIRQSGAERAFEIYIDQQLFHSAPLSSLKYVFDFRSLFRLRFFFVPIFTSLPLRLSQFRNSFV